MPQYVGTRAIALINYSVIVRARSRLRTSRACAQSGAKRVCTLARRSWPQAGQLLAHAVHQICVSTPTNLGAALTMHCRIAEQGAASHTGVASGADLRRQHLGDARHEGACALAVIALSSHVPSFSLRSHHLMHTVQPFLQRAADLQADTKGASHRWSMYVRAPDNSDLAHVISKGPPPPPLASLPLRLS